MKRRRSAPVPGRSQIRLANALGNSVGRKIRERCCARDGRAPGSTTMDSMNGRAMPRTLISVN
jgi:hypothetical protein